MRVCGKSGHPGHGDGRGKAWGDLTGGSLPKWASLARVGWRVTQGCGVGLPRTRLRSDRLKQSKHTMLQDLRSLPLLGTPKDKKELETH